MIEIAATYCLGSQAIDSRWACSPSSLLNKFLLGDFVRPCNILWLGIVGVGFIFGYLLSLCETTTWLQWWQLRTPLDNSWKDFTDWAIKFPFIVLLQWDTNPINSHQQLFLTHCTLRRVWMWTPWWSSTYKWTRPLRCAGVRTVPTAASTPTWAPPATSRWSSQRRSRSCPNLRRRSPRRKR